MTGPVTITDAVDLWRKRWRAHSAYLKAGDVDDETAMRRALEAVE